MNEAKEKEPLLSTHSTNQKFHCSKRYVLLEVIGCLHFVAFVALTPIQQFYVIDETAKKYGQQAETNKNICATSNFTNSTYDKVQEESANILTFLTFFSTALAVIPILVLGSLTDRYGRKVPLLISLFGLLAKEIVMLVTVYRGLSLWYLVIGEICIGLTGHFGLPLAAIMGMIADTTKAGQERATRITIIEAVVASAVALSNLGVGFWIKDGNYKDSIIMCVSLSTFAILLTFGCLPETLTKEKRTSSTFCSREMLGTCIKLYRKDKRRSMLIIGQIIFCINVGAVLGKVNVLTLYLLHHPLCWSEIHVQVFSCISTLINWVAIIFGVRLLHKYLKDCTIVIIGSVSAVTSLVVLAFATKDWIVYAHAVVGIMAVANSPMLRSMLSRIVEPSEQGGMFACLGSSELLLTSLAGLFYGLIYKDTVSFFPGLVFIMMAGIVVFEFCLAIVLYRLMSKEPPSATETVVVVS